MFTVTGSYITKHGLDLKNFKLLVEGVSFTNNSYGSLEPVAGVYPTELTISGGYKTITYRVSAYVSEEGLADGDLGIPVILRTGESTFQVPECGQFSTVSDILGMCQAHFKTLLV
jgi:hypothetical protein